MIYAYFCILSGLVFSLNNSFSSAAEGAIIHERFSHRGTSALYTVLNMIAHVVKDIFLSLGFSWDTFKNDKIQHGFIRDCLN